MSTIVQYKNLLCTQNVSYELWTILMCQRTLKKCILCTEYLIIVIVFILCTVNFCDI